MKAPHKKDILAILIIAIPVVLFFVRFLYPTSQLIITPDFGQSDAIASFSTKHFLAEQLHIGKLPLWSSQIGGGFPVYASGIVGMWYIPNLLLFGLFKTSIAFTLSIMTSLLLLGWGTYVWFRVLGLSRLSALFAGITISLSGYPIVQFTHLIILQSISLFPWIIAGIHKIIQTRAWKYVLFTIFFYSQLICIGFAQSIFITTLFAFFYVTWMLLRSKYCGYSIMQLLITLSAGVLLSAVQLLPSLEFLNQLNSSGKFSPQEATVFSYPFAHIITLLHPFFLGNPANGSYPHFFAFNGSIFWENTAYAGIIPFLLLCIFVITFLKKTIYATNKTTIRRSSIFFLIMLCGSFLLMTGRNSPLYFIFSFFPFTLFRVPSRFIFIFIVCYIFIAASAFHHLLQAIHSYRMKLLLACFVIVLQIYNSFFIWSPYHDLEPAAEWLKAPTLLQYLNPSGLTLTIGGERAYSSVYLENGWLRKNAEDHPSYVLRNTFTPDKNSLWGVNQLKDYSGRELKRTKIVQDLLDQSITTSDGYATISAFGTKLLSLYGVTNIISTLNLTHNSLKDHAELSSSHVKITAYTNPNAVPEAYFTSIPVVAKTISEATRTLLDDSFILGNSVLVEREQLHIASSSSNASIVVQSHLNDEYLLNIDSLDSDRILVIVQNYYPGWKMSIDGVATEIFPVNIDQIGAIVPRGSRRIRLYYQPDSLIYGTIISISTCFIIMIAVGFHLYRAVLYTHRKADSI